MASRALGGMVPLLYLPVKTPLGGESREGETRVNKSTFENKL